jgi:RNA polymerase sigma-70 factor (ECF subfamily)
MTNVGPARAPDDVALGIPDDATVIARSRDEPELFAELFRRHATTLTRYVARRLGPHAAEDVVADTFLAAFHQRNRYDIQRADARPWLYGIATNLIGRHRRTEVRQLRAYARTGLDPVLDGYAERIEARIGAEAVRRRLAGALSELKSVHRDTLLLVVWAEMTYDEAAAALGVPIGTVRSRVARARRRLANALGGVDPTAIQEER